MIAANTVRGMCFSMDKKSTASQATDRSKNQSISSTANQSINQSINNTIN